MKKRIFSNILLSVACCVGLLAILSSWEIYTPVSLEKLGKEITPFSSLQSTVAVTVKTYTSEESRAFLGRDLLSRGIKPIQITVQNNTPNSYILSASGIDLTTYPSNQVAMKITKEAIPRSVAFKVAGMIFWPFMIPGTIDSIQTFKAHKRLKKEYSVKAVGQDPVVPYSTINRIIFVSDEKYKETFDVALYNKETKQPLYFHMNATT